MRRIVSQGKRFLFKRESQTQCNRLLGSRAVGALYSVSKACYDQSGGPHLLLTHRLLCWCDLHLTRLSSPLQGPGSRPVASLRATSSHGHEVQTTTTNPSHRASSSVRVPTESRIAEPQRLEPPRVVRLSPRSEREPPRAVTVIEHPRRIRSPTRNIVAVQEIPAVSRTVIEAPRVVRSPPHVVMMAPQTEFRPSPQVSSPSTLGNGELRLTGMHIVGQPVSVIGVVHHRDSIRWHRVSSGLGPQFSTEIQGSSRNRFQIHWRQVCGELSTCQLQRMWACDSERS